MSDGRERLTLRITAEQNERLGDISTELGITNTELLRRGIGLLSIVHTAIKDSDDGAIYLCMRDAEGEFHRLHTLSDLEY